MQRRLREFLKLESASGIILFIMAILAMIGANSPLAVIQQHFIDTFLFWINEGLMTFFFLLIGLELKRGFLEGHLSSPAQIILPAFSALGGMLIPALLYLIINYTDPVAIKGFSIPVATDIAFAIGLLSLFGRRIPVGLKLFLLALAIFDDIGAMFIIVIFYSSHLSYLWLIYAIMAASIIAILHRLTLSSLALYFILGAILWICLLYAGIHPTLAGLWLGLAMPQSLKLEDKLHPWVAYCIVPLFVLANAGVSLTSLPPDVLSSNIVWGIIIGLWLGKQIGVFGFAFLLIKSGMARLPEKSNWLGLYGISLLCGIGFTMSLFLGTLSFPNENIYLSEVRLGVIIGSILSGLCGAFVLKLAFPHQKE